MRLDELTRRLDAIAWHEQVEHTLAERTAPAAVPDHAMVERELGTLAGEVDRALLDALEAEDGYLIWALRLAAHIDPAAARERARAYCDSSNARVRYWARRIARANEALEP
ncbi:hypothetical protein FHW12_004215 [Dokdonella fugitiva]|uniref:Uncharacterized protein n=1 Tax=Dokdonella fugitiva TaxID=328517 RepID=A0A839F8S9_9GAMM|nr:hypothetical protein [Dokdonella fugitiva]MBA8889968.1 hypothetical protein [Dokdonella fugitiva]